MNKHVEALANYLGELMDLQVAVQNLFSNGEEKEADHMDWYEPKLIPFPDFLSDIKEWLTGDVEKGDKQDEQKKQEELGEQEEANALLVGPEDSVSQAKGPVSKQGFKQRCQLLLSILSFIFCMLKG